MNGNAEASGSKRKRVEDEEEGAPKKKRAEDAGPVVETAAAEERRLQREWREISKKRWKTTCKFSSEVEEWMKTDEEWKAQAERNLKILEGKLERVGAMVSEVRDIMRKWVEMDERNAERGDAEARDAEVEDAEIEDAEIGDAEKDGEGELEEDETMKE